ncbi:hypothetical protein, partial [Salmonella enterica]|uniref:hypothetical protein n=1 Tax=Salmonella enterica TaxID=28901 RepID=UPI00398C31C6
RVARLGGPGSASFAGRCGGVVVMGGRVTAARAGVGGVGGEGGPAAGVMARAVVGGRWGGGGWED